MVLEKCKQKSASKVQAKCKQECKQSAKQSASKVQAKVQAKCKAKCKQSASKSASKAKSASKVQAKCKPIRTRKGASKVQAKLVSRYICSRSLVLGPWSLAAMRLGCDCMGGFCSCQLPYAVQIARDWDRWCGERHRQWLIEIRQRSRMADEQELFSTCGCIGDCANCADRNPPPKRDNPPSAKRRRVCDNPRFCVDRRCLCHLWHNRTRLNTVSEFMQVFPSLSGGKLFCRALFFHLGTLVESRTSRSHRVLYYIDQ